MALKGTTLPSRQCRSSRFPHYPSLRNQPGEGLSGLWKLDLGLYLLADLSVFFFGSLRSSLLGLHFSQDLPSLWATTQHLCLHSLPSAAACSQQVSFFAGLSAAGAEPPSSEVRHPRTTSILINFIMINASHLQPRIGPELNSTPIAH